MWDKRTQSLMTPNDGDLARAFAFVLGVSSGDTDCLDEISFEAMRAGRMPQLLIAVAELCCRAAELRDDENACADYRIACARHRQEHEREADE